MDEALEFYGVVGVGELEGAAVVRVGEVCLFDVLGRMAKHNAREYLLNFSTNIVFLSMIFAIYLVNESIRLFSTFKSIEIIYFFHFTSFKPFIIYPLKKKQEEKEKENEEKE